MSAEDEELRRIQERLQAELAARQEASKREEEIKKIDMAVRQVLTTEAWQRLKRLEMVKPELASEIKVYLLQLYSSGKITRRITDDELKVLLARIARRSSVDYNIRVV